jgi:hypothetical protein
MAVLVDEITLGEKTLYILDTDPSSGVGFDANLSDLALDSLGNMFIKVGALATDWARQATESDALAYALIFG